jgi:hypothetical protein
MVAEKLVKKAKLIKDRQKNMELNISFSILMATNFEGLCTEVTKFLDSNPEIKCDLEE